MSQTVTINTLPVPLNFGPAGPVQRTPDDIRNDLITLVSADNPGYTATLPASLIEDLSSTAVGALQMIDQAFVATVNSISPITQNAYVLGQMGLVVGPIPGQATNTQVQVQFSSPSDFGYAIPLGFIISDGTNQFILDEGAIINNTGVSNIVTATASQPGAFAVPANTVVNLVTALPPGIVLTVTNPQAGTPSAGAETVPAFRARVLLAEQAIGTGISTMVKTALLAVPGVVPRLVSFRLIVGFGWEIIVSGGDIFETANAVFLTIGAGLPLLTGSVMQATAITRANPGVVTTSIDHGYTTGGPVVEIHGALGMTAVNGVPFSPTVISARSFSIGVDTSSYGTYTGGGIVTPNFRNVVVAIEDPPDTYLVPLVNPPQQVVTMTVTWNTNDVNFTATAAIGVAAVPAIISYINSIMVGQPINLLELNDAFLGSLSGIINPTLITRLVFAISINGIGALPTTGTQIIPGDPESYFQAQASGIVVAQG